MGRETTRWRGGERNIKWEGWGEVGRDTIRGRGGERNFKGDRWGEKRQGEGARAS